jgi:transcriptional regulator with XRE-family HTH domain
MSKSSAMDTFIANLKRIMAERHLNQTELAEILGTKQPSISRILRGDEDVTISRAAKFAEALEVSLADLVLEHEFSK